MHPQQLPKKRRIWPWLFGLYMVRRVRQNRQEEIDKEVQKQLANQQNNPPPS